MSALASRFTITGDVRCFAGEALTVEIAFDNDGTLIDLTGRTFAWTVYRANDREPMFSAAGIAVSVGDDHCIRFAIDGDTTDELFATNRIGLRHEIAEISEAGRDLWVEGQFSVARSAATVAPVSVDASAASVTRFAFEYDTRRLVISPRGAPGMPIWQALGLTEEQYRAEQAQAGADAGEAAGQAAGAAAGAAAVQPSLDALDDATARANALTAVLSVWVPPGAVMNMGSPINLLLAGE